MRRAIPLVLLVLALSACGGVAGTAGGGNPNAITNDQLRELDSEGLSVYKVIERLRPNWLRSRGVTSFGGGPSTPRPVVDGAPYGELSALDAMGAREVQAIEFVSAGDATTRFGTGYPGGAILVRTR